MRALVLLAAEADDRLCHDAASRASEALRAKGHEVTLRDLHAEGFAVAMTPAEREAYHGDVPILDPLVAEHAALVGAAQIMVFVYPTSLSTMPPILKGWLERVMVPGVGFVLDDRNKVRPGLGHVRRIVGISTYPDRWLEVKRTRDSGRRTFTRALRVSSGFRTRTAWVSLYSSADATSEQREAFLDQCARKAC